MAELWRLATNRVIEEEASAWLARIDANLTPEVRAGLIEWLRADPRHVATFMRMAALWDELEIMHELSALFPLPAPSGRPRATARHGWALAAALGTLAIGAAVGMWQLLPRLSSELSADGTAPQFAATDTSAGSAADVAHMTTAVGERRSVRLSDGSIVQLNTATELRVAFSPSARKVTLLRGEAQFDVFHDAARPFFVQVGSRTVRAVGTAFNVRLGEDRLVVVVTEGRVSIAETSQQESNGARPAILVNAGELAEVSPTRAVVARVEPTDRETRLAWQRGMLKFDGEPLSSALTEVERYTAVRFEIKDPAIRDLRIGGYYRIGDVDGLLLSLEENFSLAISRNGNHISIDSAGAR